MIAVTGATGYVGRSFCSAALSNGHQILILGRRDPNITGCSYLPYDINSTDQLSLPSEVNVLVHLAIVPNSLNTDGSGELASAGMLIKASNNVGAKLIFVSSQAAAIDAPTAYGRTKWLIEQRISNANGIIVRPGQVYGGCESGLFGELVKVVKRSPVLPMFVPPPLIQPIHVDDLATCLLELAESDELNSKVVFLGSDTPISFTEFLRLIARKRLFKTRIFIPIPVIIVTFTIKLLGGRFGLERLNSLFSLRPMRLDCDRFQMRDIAAGMHRSGNDSRRKLLIEARAVISYVLTKSPNVFFLSRYARAIAELKNGKDMRLPLIFTSFPSTLTLLDCRGAGKDIWQKEFMWRIDSATAIAEASTLGARVFLGSGISQYFLKNLAELIYAVFRELFWRLLTLILSPLIYWYLAKLRLKN